ncbi:TatD family hydrolase [Albibacterium indicum]|uniref:TatD family hydrolase n=1 Tax=Albibacterium indicum TaxID=2292082 RepID=UPI000E53843F|nr:TatD family hydrolase [Pedobacter indicus]
MQLTDTHTHIYYQAGGPELAKQMDRCFENQVGRLFLPNVDSNSIDKVMQTVSAYPDHCYPMLGLHPCSVKEDYRLELETIEKALSQYKVYAIGEIGLDLYWDKTKLKEQIEAFKIQVDWAKDRNLPIVIHCRDAFDELFTVLKDLRDDKLRGIFHCFTGTLEQAKEAIEYGFYLGIGGVVTFKNAGLDKVVEEVSLDHIVLETDSPYLAPAPFRGKENESSYLYHIAEKVADLHQRSIEEIAEITTQNSKNIFGV